MMQNTDFGKIELFDGELPVGYRDFYDGPSKSQWRNAQPGRYQGIRGIEQEVEVRVVPFTTLYDAENIVIDGGHGCMQVYEVAEHSWVRCASSGRRAVAKNADVQYEVPQE